MYPKCAFYAIGDDYGAIKALSDAAVKNGSKVRFLLDVNMGMNRTGVELDKAEELARQAVHALNLRFASVDLVECRDGWKVLEVNSGVMMENLASNGMEYYLLAKKIYRKAIQKMFSFIKYE